MKLRIASPVICDSIVDGPGLRMVIWTQGCKHNCKGCHNPQTHSLDGGYEVDTKEIIDNPVNPFTGNTIRTDDKNSGSQYILSSEETSEPSTSTYQYTIRGPQDFWWEFTGNDIFNNDNWKKVNQD